MKFPTIWPSVRGAWALAGGAAVLLLTAGTASAAQPSVGGHGPQLRHHHRHHGVKGGPGNVFLHRRHHVSHHSGVAHFSVPGRNGHRFGGLFGHHELHVPGAGPGTRH